MHLEENHTKDTRNPILFTRGKVELVLTKEAEWEFAQDISSSEEVLDRKTFTFGERYGILKHNNKNDSDKSFLNINGKTWYISTIEETAMPVLRSITNRFVDYMELKEVAEYRYAFTW